MTQQLKKAASIWAFVYLSSIIMITASERIFWYWAGFSADSVLVIALFYLLPVSAGLWTMALVPVRRAFQVVLVGALYSFVTEGILTPVTYADGPLPILAAMFIGWHGLISFAGFWYLARRWLVNRSSLALAVGSATVGLAWGVWALASAVGDPPSAEEALEGGLDLTVLEPAEFALYALMVGASFAGAHWLIGFVWPSGWRPGQASTRFWILANVLYMSVAVLLVVPWAPLKLAILIAGTWRLLKRPIWSADMHEPTLLDRLGGKARFRDCLLLLIMPIVAAGTYATLWPQIDRGSALETAYWGLVATQIFAGGIAYLWAWRRSSTERSPS